MAADRKTLTDVLAETQFPAAEAAGDLRTLLLELALACEAMWRHALARSLRDSDGEPTGACTTGGEQAELVLLADDTLPDGPGREDIISSVASALVLGPRSAPCGIRRGCHLVTLHPVDSPPDAATGAGGAIFSILRAEGPGRGAVTADFLRSGFVHVCAGYVIYGPTATLVLSMGSGVQAFALDLQDGAFVLIRADVRIPKTTCRIAIDASDMRLWEPAVRRYVDECLAGEAGPRGKDFRFHWLGSPVAEAHRVLMGGGGVFVCPGGGGIATRGGWPWLLHEASPISFMVEQAGGRAFMGTGRAIGIEPGGALLRTPLIFGAAEEVERLQAWLGDRDADRYDTPLFAERGLFRAIV